MERHLPLGKIGEGDELDAGSMLTETSSWLALGTWSEEQIRCCRFEFSKDRNAFCPASQRLWKMWMLPVMQLGCRGGVTIRYVLPFSRSPEFDRRRGSARRLRRVCRRLGGRGRDGGMLVSGGCRPIGDQHLRAGGAVRWKGERGFNFNEVGQDWGGREKNVRE